MTCLCNFPPMIDILERLKPNIGFMNFINTRMLHSLVQIWDGVRHITAGLENSVGSSLKFTAGLRESEGHIYIYQEETPNK